MANYAEIMPLDLKLGCFIFIWMFKKDKLLKMSTYRSLNETGACFLKQSFAKYFKENIKIKQS